MSWKSLKEIEEYCAEHNCEFWQAILDGDAAERETTAEASRRKMNTAWEAMIAASEDYNPLNFSASGLVGDDGEKMRRHTASGSSIMDGFVGEVMTEALKMGECNACMKRIVAAPTAGACGVLPSVLLPMSKRGTDTEKILNAEVVVWATPIYYYEMCGQMKTMIDRANSLYSRDYQFGDVYLLSVAAEDGDDTDARAVSGINGWIDCFEHARFAGKVFAGGVDDPGTIEGHAALEEAYELGRSV